MNAKELRQAAEKTMSLKGSISNAAIALADHILATVREDDDDPAEDEWQWEILRLSGCNLNTSQRVYAIWDQVSRKSRQDRGQFRSLCRGLGIKLKEQQ